MLLPGKRPDFPRVIDNSMRMQFIECPRKFALRYLYHLVRGSSIHLHAGSVFAKGIEVVRRAIYGPMKMSVDDALVYAFRPMVKEWAGVAVEDDALKRFDRVVGALEYYFRSEEAYPPHSDHIKPLMSSTGEPFVEWNAVAPLPINHPQTGEPLLYSGYFDMFGLMGESTQCIVDEKTTSQLGGQWVGKWRLRSQFTGYAWLAHEYSYPVRAAVIRGVAFYKNGYGTQEAIVYRPDWHIKMWYAQLLRDVRRMIQAWEEGYFDLNLGDECGKFGGCMFTELCDTNDPGAWLSQYKVEPYDPTHRYLLVKKAA